MPDIATKVYRGNFTVLAFIGWLILIPILLYGIYTNSIIYIIASLFSAAVNIIAYFVRRRKSVEIGPGGIKIITGSGTKFLPWSNIASVTKVRGLPFFGFIEVKTTSSIYYNLSDELANDSVLGHIRQFKIVDSRFIH